MTPTTSNSNDSAAANTTRILMTGSRDFTNGAAAVNMLEIALTVTGARAVNTVLVHGAARGADLLLASVATQMKMSTEAHPANWQTHTEACPDWDKGKATCKLAGHRRNAEMIATGATLCLAFPTHSQILAPGESRANTSRGTWDCATAARAAGIPTLVLWNTGQEARVFPFGDPAAQLIAREAARKGGVTGVHGSMALLDMLLPF